MFVSITDDTVDFFYPTFCYNIWSLNPSGAEAWIFPESWVNAISADVLATFIARTSAAMMLTVHEKCLSRGTIWISCTI